MIDEQDRLQAERVVNELRASATALIERSRAMAEEAERLKRRADDLAQLIRQRAVREGVDADDAGGRAEPS